MLWNKQLTIRGSNMEKLTTAEYRYMRVIWEHPEGISSSELYKPYPITMGAQSTTLRGVVHKGYATSQQRGKQVFYYPVGTRLEYDRKTMGEQFKKKLGVPSLSALVAAFCGRDSLSAEEQEKLEHLIQELEHNQPQKKDDE